MTRKATRSIRKVDRRHIVWQEPNVLFNFGPESHLPKIGSNSGFSFHVYCLDNSAPACPTMESVPFDNADDMALETDRALMLTEFGATNEHPRIEHIVDLAGEHTMSWMWWAYCGCDDPTTTGPGNLQAIVKDPAKPPRGSNVLHRKLALLERPYPQAVAGTPTGFVYDPDTNKFQLAYRTTAPDGERLGRHRKTRVYVPRSHYPDGYRARVTGARVISDPDARYLVLERHASARNVSLKVTPAR